MDRVGTQNTNQCDQRGNEPYPSKCCYLLSALFALVSIGAINQYHYPGMEHAVVVPMLKRMMHPALYPGDLLVDQYHYLYSIVWPVIAQVALFLNIELPLIFFILYCLNIYGLFLVFYLLSYRLFADNRIAVLGCFLFLLNRTFLGGDYLFDQVFDTAGCARLFLLASLATLLTYKYFRAGALLGLGFSIHPLSGIYATVLFCGSFIWNYANTSSRERWLFMSAALIGAMPVLLWKACIHPDNLLFAGVDSEWLSIIRLRSPDHIAADIWHWSAYLSFAICFPFATICAHKFFSGSTRKIMLGQLSGIFSLVIFGILTAYVPLSPLLIQLQLCRGSVLLGPFVALLLSAFMVKSIEMHRSPRWQCLLLLLIPPLLYSPGAGSWTYLTVAVLALSLFLIVLIRKAPSLLQSTSAWVLPTILMSIALGSGALVKRGGFSLAPRIDSEWHAVQDWARENSDQQSLFVVPPESRGFRIYSERTVYGTWYDGLVSFFDPQAAKEWMFRMKQLGFQQGQSTADLGKAFSRLAPDDVLNQVSQLNHYSSVYLVTTQQLEGSSPQYPVLYVSESGKYSVIQLR